MKASVSLMGDGFPHSHPHPHTSNSFPQIFIPPHLITISCYNPIKTFIAVVIAPVSF